MLGETGEGGGGVYLLGDFSMWEGEVFFQVGGIRKILAACPHPPSGIENPG